MKFVVFILCFAGCATQLGEPSDGGGAVADRPRMDLPLPFDIAVPRTCISSCNRCQGVCCGTACCNAGEWCGADGACHCGNGAGCNAPEICAGPISVGNNACGSICCGAGNPCPL